MGGGFRQAAGPLAGGLAVVRPFSGGPRCADIATGQEVAPIISNIVNSEMSPTNPYPELTTRTADGGCIPAGSMSAAPAPTLLPATGGFSYSWEVWAGKGGVVRRIGAVAAKELWGLLRQPQLLLLLLVGPVLIMVAFGVSLDVRSILRPSALVVVEPGSPGAELFER